MADTLQGVKKYKTQGDWVALPHRKSQFMVHHVMENFYILKYNNSASQGVQAQEAIEISGAN